MSGAMAITNQVIPMAAIAQIVCFIRPSSGIGFGLLASRPSSLRFDANRLQKAKEGDGDAVLTIQVVLGAQVTRTD
jgi:hypothetical protein